MLFMTTEVYITLTACLFLRLYTLPFIWDQEELCLQLRGKKFCVLCKAVTFQPWTVQTQRLTWLLVFNKGGGGSWCRGEEAELLSLSLPSLKLTLKRNREKSYASIQTKIYGNSAESEVCKYSVSWKRSLTSTTATRIDASFASGTVLCVNLLFFM